MCKKYKVMLAIIICSFVFAFDSYADESALFTSVAPDALIIIDLSKSMEWTPGGSGMYIHSSYDCGNDVAYYESSGSGHTKYCYQDCYGTVAKYGNCSCSGPFYRSSRAGYETDCSRLAIAKRAIFDILDDNNDDAVDDLDEDRLAVRIGYMRFKNGNDTAGDYSSGNIELRKAIDSSYSDIWSLFNAESANSGTPLASSLNESKSYIDDHKAGDAAKNCRQKFAILITDGEDTYACGGDGGSNQTDMYKRRRETVAKAKVLADAGYKIFVVGFGANMPYWLKNTLNWAAYYGNTDNPLVANSGNTTAYNPSSVTSCQTSEYTDDGSHYYATSNDPGEDTLLGYAFLASSASELNIALKQAINIIREATYSFSEASVSSSRAADENYIYEASFLPINNDPFWFGYLKKYSVNEDGSIGSIIWDAGSVLQSTDPGSRTIYTYKSGALVPFTTFDITKEDLETATDTERDAIIGYIRGESDYNPDNWKLGDIFRCSPVTIGTPSVYFYDIRDENNAFDEFREANQRTSANGKRVIVAGANDGQMHAFKTNTGAEIWSFIPPNLLPKLKNIAHSSHPTGLSHQYFVDGSVTAADVWLGTGDGTSKIVSDWKTLMIFGEGRGSGERLWSSSSSCDCGFNSTYSTDYPYYCGYYCFEVTNPLSPPAYKWRINPTASQAPYLGDPWCKVYVGRVKVNGYEKWVGFMGAGYNASDKDQMGKGFFVIDLSNGNILWSLTQADNSNMKYSIPSTVAIVDTDNDGFIDTAYVGDLGGDMWRFKFCTSIDGSSCSTYDWSGSILFDAPTGVIRPIFTSPAVAKSKKGDIWVYWGTGDKTDPTAANAQEKFYAVKDADRTTTYTINDLENITSSVYDDSSIKRGWYINFAGMGEKVLAEPTVFGGVVYFTTFTPNQSADPCLLGGAAKLYGVDHVTGSGIFSESGDRDIDIGSGIPSAPIISLKPGSDLPPDLYVTVSGGGGVGARTFRVPFNPPSIANRTNMLFWRDQRLQ